MEPFVSLLFPNHRRNAEGNGVDVVLSASPEFHVCVICAAILLSALGRWLNMFAFRVLEGVTTSVIVLLLTLVFCALTAIVASASGLLHASLAVGGCASLVTVCSWKPRVVLFGVLVTLASACLVTPQLLPTVLPPLYLATAQDSETMAPYSQSRIALSEQITLSARIQIIFDDVSVVAANRRSSVVLYHTNVISIGKRTILDHLDITLAGSSHIALLGEQPQIRNCTIRCEVLPCIWVLHTPQRPNGEGEEDATATTAEVPLFVDTFVEFESERLELKDADCHHSRVIGCVSRQGRSTTSILKHQFSEATASISISDVPSTSMPPDLVRSIQQLIDRTPMSIFLCDQAPLVLHTLHRVLAFLWERIAQPSLYWLKIGVMWLCEAATPLASYLYLLMWKIFAAVACECISLSAVQSGFCVQAKSAYAEDATFAMLSASVSSCIAFIKTMDGVPVVSPSLHYAWRLEVAAACSFWRALGDVTVTVLTLSIPVTVCVMKPLTSTILVGVQHVSSVVWWSLRTSFAQSLPAIALNRNIIRLIGVAAQPFVGLISLLLVSVWRWLAVYVNVTSASTHLFVIIVQSAVLSLVLWNDFKSRLVRKDANKQWWFVRSVTTVPFAALSMLQHFSKPVMMYGAVHLVSVCLVLGTSLLPFGSMLYTAALQIVLPASSTYGWLLFFHDPDDRWFWWQVALKTVLKALVSTLLQKTVGDFLFHIVWEVIIGLLIVCVCFTVVVMLGKRKHLVSPTVSARIEEVPSREIH